MQYSMQAPKDDVMLLWVSRFRPPVEACHSLAPSPSISEQTPRILRNPLVSAAVRGLSLLDTILKMAPSLTPSTPSAGTRKRKRSEEVTPITWDRRARSGAHVVVSAEDADDSD